MFVWVFDVCRMEDFFYMLTSVLNVCILHTSGLFCFFLCVFVWVFGVCRMEDFFYMDLVCCVL